MFPTAEAMASAHAPGQPPCGDVPPWRQPNSGWTLPKRPRPAIPGKNTMVTICVNYLMTYYMDKYGQKL